MGFVFGEEQGILYENVGAGSYCLLFGFFSAGVGIIAGNGIIMFLLALGQETITARKMDYFPFMDDFFATDLICETVYYSMGKNKKSRFIETPRKSICHCHEISRRKIR